MQYYFETYNGLKVAWTAQLDGGGRSFGQQIVPVVQRLVGNVDRVFELCAGPGFMGFSLLAHGLCNSLCLSDINPAAIAAIERTIDANQLHGRVSAYLSDGLDAIPASELWDLVVANPPHFDRPQRGAWDLITNDPAWRVHKRFYSTVRPHLTSRGLCFLQENYEGSCEHTFMPFLDHSGLEYVGSLMLSGDHGAPLEERIVHPLNTIYFFITRIKYPDFVWHESSAATSVEITLLDVDILVSVDQQGATTMPFTLPAGRKYQFTLSNRRPRAAALTIAWSSGFVPVEIPAASMMNEQPVFIPTAPTTIADRSSGRVLVMFV